jgi:hypothetical protein
VVHTRLGEEGAEAVIGLSGLALVGEEAIGLKWRSATALREGRGTKASNTYLDAVLKAVKLQEVG